MGDAFVSASFGAHKLFGWIIPREASWNWLRRCGLPGLDRQDVMLRHVHFRVSPRLGRSIGGASGDPTIGHLVATVIGVGCVLIPVEIGRGGRKRSSRGLGENQDTNSGIGGFRFLQQPALQLRPVTPGSLSSVLHVIGFQKFVATGYN